MQVSETSDDLDPARADALRAALNLDGPPFRAGDPLPPFFHQVYFWNPLPPARLGRDGHPARPPALADAGLTRRMWAGGRLDFAHSLECGRRAQRRTIPGPLSFKTGRSGPLAFQTLTHEIVQDGIIRVTERQDLVFRAEPGPDARPPEPIPARRDETQSAEQDFSSTLLFRYSALTFNGHRIHYDADYARQVEGYDGLVVHGPLLAQLLMLMADALAGPLRRFTFRAAAPLIAGEGATLCRAGRDLWVRAADGREIMTASLD
ncbi:mesaconyl-C4 CoA hydratase [Profundibacterium mesophilum KAUST100406-0324]|uniref:Mesaconyl-C4 CoA hydratase n=2 Tax=Profundibacterium TaxID=1258570 RepID=A0A921NPK0_9RHOB|nr:mesaconyl-C4 CoA hydratase [Profundibacterium mesophilum KAUST100406-0324]